MFSKEFVLREGRGRHLVRNLFYGEGKGKAFSKEFVLRGGKGKVFKQGFG